MEMLRNKRGLPEVPGASSKKKVCVRSKEVCNARILLINSGVEWSSSDPGSLKPLPSKRTKTGYVGTFQVGNRWQAQYLHRTLGAYSTAYEAGCAVTRAVVQLASLRMSENSDETVFHGCLSSLAAKEGSVQASIENMPSALTGIGKDTAVPPRTFPAHTRCEPALSLRASSGIRAPVPVRPVHPGNASANISSPISASCFVPQAAPYDRYASTEVMESMPHAALVSMSTAPPPMRTKYEPEVVPAQSGASSVSSYAAASQAPFFSAPLHGPVPPLPLSQQRFNEPKHMGQPVFFPQPSCRPEPGSAQRYPYGGEPTTKPTPSFMPLTQATLPSLPLPAPMLCTHTGWIDRSHIIHVQQPFTYPSSDPAYWNSHSYVP